LHQVGTSSLLILSDHCALIMAGNIHSVTEFNTLEGLNLWICMCSNCINVTEVRLNNMSYYCQHYKVVRSPCKVPNIFVPL